jgi:hypothetical protein
MKQINNPNNWILAISFLLLLMAGSGKGLAMIFSSLKKNTKI